MVRIFLVLLLFGLISFSNPLPVYTQENNSDYQQALELYKNNNYSEALDKFILITSTDTQNWDAYLYIGLCYFHSGKYTDARDVFTRLIESTTNFYPVYYYAGVTQIKLKDYKQATEHLLKAQEYEPEKESVHYNLGLAYFYQNEFNLSLKSLEKAIAVQPDSPEVYYLVGLIYYKTNNFENAETYFKKTLEADTKQRFNVDIKKYLKIIKSKSGISLGKNLSLSFYFAANSDNNVNSTPGSYYSAADQSDIYYIAGVSGVLSSFKFINVSGSVYSYSYSSNTALNMVNLGLGADTRWELNKQIVFYARYNYYNMYLNNSLLSVYQQIVPRLEIIESPTLSTVFSYEYNLKNYQNTNYQYLNGYASKYYLDQYLYFHDKRGYIKLSGNIGTEKSGNMSGEMYGYSYYNWNTQTSTLEVVNIYNDYSYNYSYQNQKLSAELYFPLLNTVYLLVSYSLDKRTYLDADVWSVNPSDLWYKNGTVWQKYENSNWVTQPGSTGPAAVKHTKKRVDDEQNITVYLTKVLSNKLYLFLNYSQTINKSNFAAQDYADYNYQRQIISVSAQYSF